jgi:stromal membrane-associated protein
MGTHISKVRSIDLDSWSDEHMEKMITWGNRRANLYWENKLPPNYVPDDSKIQNFIRTKYDLKRWVMSGGMPDPATLDDQAEDSVPLSTVQKQLNHGEKAPAPKPRPAESSAGLIPDLLGGDSQPTRAPAVNEQINTNAVDSKPPATNKQPPPAKIQTSKPATDSLLGLDFSSPPGSGSPTSATSNSPVSNQPAAAASSRRASRPDLKKSILSLYSNPRPQQPQPQQQQQQQQHFVQPQMQAQTAFQQPQPAVAGSGGANMFDSLTSATNNLSLNNNTATSPPASTTKTGNNGMFDDLLSSSSASAWASTAPSHGSAASPPTNNQPTDEWSTFTSASTTTAHTPAKPLSGLEDEIFGNVWK